MNVMHDAYHSRGYREGPIMHEDVSQRVNALQGLAFHTLLPLLKWNKGFAVDESTIDAQHEAIFEMALEASELAKKRSDDERLLKMFERFGRALESHFRFEEDMLGKIDYPDLDDHRAQHQAMLAEFDFVRRRITGDAGQWSFQHQSLIIVNFMIGVTVGHILSADVDYAQYMHRKAEAA